MSIIARLEITPVSEGSMADVIADAVDALDEFDVDYETTAVGTIVESDRADEVFAAASAAHEAVDEERHITELKVDDLGEREEHAAERVAAVEARLGRPPHGEREHE